MKQRLRFALFLLGYCLVMPAQAIILDEEPEKPKGVKAIPKVPKVKHKSKAVVSETESTSRVDIKPECLDCPEMVSIPAGSFMMGSSSAEQDGQNDEKPRHQIQVNRFALGKYEVTRQQFGLFVDDTGYSAGSSCYTLETGEYELHNNRNWQDPAFTQSSNHPVVCVSLDDAEAYVRWLSQKTGKRYRLPTEAEWEYAARAGTQTARYWGDESSNACTYANVADQTGASQLSWDATKVHSCSDGYVYTAPVGSFRANAFGLYDMLGNVWERTCSTYTVQGYDGSENACTNSASSRLSVRGGSWYGVPAYVRSASRLGFEPTDRIGDRGFRLAQDN